MRIITATHIHLDDIYKLLCELENNQLDKLSFTKVYKDNLDNSNVYYFIAIDNEIVIGFASLHIQKLLHHCDKIGEVQELIVTKSFQGNGVGNILLNHIKEIAIENECIQLEVCCNIKREKSHQFYMKNGMIKSHYKFTYPLNCIKK